MVLTLRIDSKISFDYREFRKRKPRTLKTLVKKFKKKNPTFQSNERNGFSNHDTDEYLKAIKLTKRGRCYVARGCKSELLSFFRKHKIKYDIVDKTLTLKQNYPNEMKCTPRPEQAKFIELVKKNHEGIIEAPTSFGKCHEKGYQVLKYSGELVNVEDVKVGDLLMGPDSKPRKVLKTCRGAGQLYKVKPYKGEPFIINSEHKLSLKVTGGSGFSQKTFYKDAVHNIQLCDYMKLSKSKRHILKLWRTGVEFGERKTPVDSYYLGLWIGDGSKGGPTITNNDEYEIINFLKRYSGFLGYNLKETSSKNKCSNFTLQTDTFKNNKLRQYLRSNCLIGKKIGTDVKGFKKIIPEVFLHNTRKRRMKLLAGIIDSDGYLINNKASYEVFIKDYDLSQQVAYLVRSLGLNCGVSKKETSYKKNGERIYTGIGYRLYISGDTLDELPLKLERKKVQRKQFKNALTSGFTVEKCYVGEYYGFELDKDHLYLGYDFTVHHNTLTTLMTAKALNQPLLILVHRSLLQEQWMEEATNPKTFNLDKGLIGGCGGIFKKPKVGLVNICLYQSLSKPEYLKMFGNVNGMFVFDEVQYGPIEACLKIINHIPAKYKLGVSADIKRKDKKDFMTRWYLGPILKKFEDKASKNKILASVALIESPYTDSEYDWDSDAIALETRATRDKVRNKIAISRTKRRLDMGNIALMTTSRKYHACRLAKHFTEKGYRVGLILGAINKKKDIPDYAVKEVVDVMLAHDHKDDYKRVKTLAEKKELDIVICTHHKAGVGMSITTFDYLMCMSMITGNIELLNQLLGRIERTYTETQEKDFGHLKAIPTAEFLWDCHVGKKDKDGYTNKYKHKYKIKNKYKKRFRIVKYKD